MPNTHLVIRHKLPCIICCCGERWGINNHSQVLRYQLYQSVFNFNVYILVDVKQIYSFWSIKHPSHIGESMLRILAIWVNLSIMMNFERKWLNTCYTILKITKDKHNGTIGCDWVTECDERVLLFALDRVTIFDIFFSD